MTGAQPETNVPVHIQPPTASPSQIPPPPPKQIEIPITAQPAQVEATILALGPVGGFQTKVEPLPAVRIENVEDAGNRLGLLKTRINFLQNAGESNNDMMMMILCCILLGPIGLCIALCMSNSSEEKEVVKKETIKCIQQINALRDRYQSDPSWPQREQMVEKIRQSVFTQGIDRNLLKGTL